MKTKKQKGYLHRITAAQLKHPELFAPGSKSNLHLAHDDWCKVYQGKDCNCYPDITIATEQGTYAMGHDGRCVNVN